MAYLRCLPLGTPFRAHVLHHSEASVPVIKEPPTRVDVATDWPAVLAGVPVPALHVMPKPEVATAVAATGVAAPQPLQPSSGCALARGALIATYVLLGANSA